MGKDYVPTLTPEGWLYHGHLVGIHVWMPAPATALISLKQLAQAKHKRPYTTTHVVLILRLLYQEEWQMRFKKEMDILFVLSAGSHWPSNAHEPLLVGLIFPLFSSFLWQLRLESKKVVDIGCSLSALSKQVMFKLGAICANYGTTGGRFQRCKGAWCAGCFMPHELDCFAINVARDFNAATPGDHLCTHFQCPDCHSQNILGIGLVKGNAWDEAFMALAIWATLDAFWAHAAGTVPAHLAEVRFMVKYGAALGFTPMPPLGPVSWH
eukprot:CCRYP_006692-RA/>CCRYP_006692-RA protein AED:0.38 eAED:0.38 QI:0/0/0/1/0/0/2/0/266